MSATREPRPADWKQIAQLGEQLRGTPSLSAQRDQIARMTEQHTGGTADVWLNESIFRLPDWGDKALFPPEPPLDGMRQAYASGKAFIKSPAPGSDSPEACVAIPIEDQGAVIGILHVARPQGPAFKKNELALLESVAGIAAVGLVAAHRLEVERWRIGQLTLVSKVASQVAHVSDVDELARRVTALIRKTFNYYYVAMFTTSPGSGSVNFRASDATPRKGRRKPAIPLEIELGTGLIGYCAQSGEEIICDDVQTEPRYRHYDSLPETRSEVVLPLKIEDRVLGVLDVQSNQVDAFHPYDLLVLRALADAVAVAVEGTRLYRDLRRRADQLEVVAAVSNSVTTTLDLEKLMGDAATLIHDRFGYPYVHLFSVHPNRRQVIYEAGSGKRSKKLHNYVIPLDEPLGIIPWVARNGEAVLANDVTLDPRYRPSSLPPEVTRSELTVPLIFDGQVVGVLDIQSDAEGVFNQDDRMIFEAVAGSLAAAIHNADLFSSEQWRRQVADSLREVAGLLSANVGIEQVLEAILVELEHNLPSDISAIWLLDEGELYPAAVRGSTLAELHAARHASPDAAVQMASALLSGEPLVRRPDEPIGPSGLAGGYKPDYSSIAAPLRIGDQPVGVLTLAHSTPGRYGHEARAMTATFASYAAVAIENTRLYDSSQEQAYASAALLQVAQAVVSLNDLDEILGTIIRIMPILVGVARSVVYLWDDSSDSFYPAMDYGLDEEAAEVLLCDEYRPGDFPLLDAVRESNRMLILAPGSQTSPRAWTDSPPPDEAAQEQALREDSALLLAVPLAMKHELYGVMLVQEVEDGRRFRNRRLEIIAGIAQQVALAIQNDMLQKEMVVRERLETEVELARQIQQTFIPEHLPSRPGWDLAARWRTARQVGGDFYDVFELPGGRIGLFIADVADKGVPAALFMALTRTLVRAAVADTDSPAAALSRVNNLLFPDTEQGMFVTGVYSVLDPQTGSLTYANAGHNPPLVHHADHRLERLTRTGMALGVVDGMEITERTITLVPGDCLFFYTDGLTESFSPNNEAFGEQRLHEKLIQLDTTACCAQDVLAAIEKAVDEFSAPLPPADDLTMIVVCRKASEK
jgi:GAF domain-containing protein